MNCDRSPVAEKRPAVWGEELAQVSEKHAAKAIKGRRHALAVAKVLPLRAVRPLCSGVFQNAASPTFSSVKWLLSM
jgi:hypothetical protein